MTEKDNIGDKYSEAAKQVLNEYDKKRPNYTASAEGLLSKLLNSPPPSSKMTYTIDLEAVTTVLAAVALCWGKDPEHIDPFTVAMTAKEITRELFGSKEIDPTMEDSE